MPTVPLRPCRHWGCPNLSDCPQHAGEGAAKEYDRARRDDPLRIYNTTRWRALRTLVLQRDLLCKICGDEASTEADHIIPTRSGGAVWSIENLQGLCSSCHAKKTRRENNRRGGCRSSFP
jgi:5-methylcytosine-specific restriction protein A